MSSRELIIRMWWRSRCCFIFSSYIVSQRHVVKWITSSWRQLGWRQRIWHAPNPFSSFLPSFSSSSSFMMKYLVLFWLRRRPAHRSEFILKATRSRVRRAVEPSGNTFIMFLVQKCLYWSDWNVCRSGGRKENEAASFKLYLLFLPGLCWWSRWEYIAESSFPFLNLLLLEKKNLHNYKKKMRRKKNYDPFVPLRRSDPVVRNIFAERFRAPFEIKNSEDVFGWIKRRKGRKGRIKRRRTVLWVKARDFSYSFLCPYRLVW